MEEKISFIFKFAVQKQYKRLILGALGCGAYKNPQREIIKLFQQAIEKYKYSLETIVFAIYDPVVSSGSNYTLFLDAFNSKKSEK